MSFKNFLLNEDTNYLGRKVGDVLTAAEQLQGDMENIGSRHLNRLAEKIVNQIRKILHGSWSQKQHHHLEKVQKIAVAIQKTIDERGDLKEILPSAVAELQNVSNSLGVKVNNIEAPEMAGGEDVSQQDFQLTGDGQQQSNQEQPDQSQQMPSDQMPQQPQPDQMQQMPQQP